MRLTKITKLEMAKKHVEDGIPLYELAKIYKYDVSRIKYYSELYKLHGEAPFVGGDKAKTYTKEMKLENIKKVLSGKYNCRSLALKIGLSDPTILSDWVKKYEKDGIDGVKDTFSRAHYLKHEERIDVIAEKSLKDRLEYLEAENEYLKKLYALTLKGRTQQKKR